jgi:hypothetical protein
LVKLQNDAAVKVINYQRKLLDSQTSLIEAEAKGQSWRQRKWRPITMITFLILVVCNGFGILEFRLNNETWLLLEIRLGIYVVGGPGK